LIITVPASDADYQGLQLASRWFLSLDYKHRQSSLSRDQTSIDSDGNIRYIISRFDPGVWNWLDTESHKTGLIMLRWQGASSKPVSAINAEIVTRDEISNVLPNDTRFVSEAERSDQIRARVLTIAKRYQ